MTSMIPAGVPMPQMSLPGTSGSSTFQKYGLAMRFKVEVGGMTLGHWASCEGLKVEFKTENVADGGSYGYQAVLPVAISYGPVTLKRAMLQADSDKVMTWLRAARDQWVNYDGTGQAYPSYTATITLLDVYGAQVQSWTLRDVYPVSWSGPALSAEQSKIAVETLVIEHEGFL